MRIKFLTSTGKIVIEEFSRVEVVNKNTVILLSPYDKSYKCVSKELVDELNYTLLNELLIGGYIDFKENIFTEIDPLSEIGDICDIGDIERSSTIPDTLDDNDKDWKLQRFRGIGEYKVLGENKYDYTDPDQPDDDDGCDVEDIDIPDTSEDEDEDDEDENPNPWKPFHDI